MAGPWFAVQSTHDDWQTMSDIWISNGEEDCQGKVEIKVELHEPDAENVSGTALVAGG